MEKAAIYLEDSLQRQYLDLLPSRWSALLPRLAKRTQRLQSTTDIAAAPALEKELAEDFHLATQLLTMELALYEDGVLLFQSLCAVAGGDPVWRTWDLLSRDMLTELAAKEMMLAHWKAAVAAIPSDTLRVYSHALLVHSRVTPARVQQLLDLVNTAQLCSSV